MISSLYSRDANLDPQPLADADDAPVARFVSSDPAPVLRAAVPAAEPRGDGLVINPVVPSGFGAVPQPVLFDTPAAPSPVPSASPRPAVASVVSAPVGVSGGETAEPQRTGRAAAWAALGVLVLLLVLFARRRK